MIEIYYFTKNMDNDRTIAISKFNEKNFDEAIELLNHLLMRQQIFIEDINMLGLSYFHTEEYESALITFLEIFKYSSNIPFVRTNIAKTLWMIGIKKKTEVKEQIKVLKEALSFDSSCYEIWYHLAQLYIKKNNLKHALYCIQTSARLNSDDIEVQMTLGKISKMNVRYVDAMNAFKYAYDKQPENEEAKTEYEAMQTQVNLPPTNKIEIGRIMYYYRNIQKICDHIYIGSGLASQTLKTLKKNNITHVLNVSAEITNAFENSSEISLIYKSEPFADLVDADIIKTGILERCLEFINNVIENNGNVLVHCAAGMSRSGAIIIGYLMRTRKISFKEALIDVRKVRQCISPNSGFTKQLIDYFDEITKQEQLRQAINIIPQNKLTMEEDMIAIHDVVVSKQSQQTKTILPLQSQVSTIREITSINDVVIAKLMRKLYK